MRYVFHSRVSAIEKKRRAVRTYKTGAKGADGKDEIAVEYENLGWYVRIEPLAESISLGDAEPPWLPGQSVKLTIEDEDADQH